MKSSFPPSNSAPTPGNPYTGWGALAGAVIGAIIGIWTRHWMAWASGLATVGLVAGALIDRGRR